MQFKNPEVTVRMRGVMEKCTFCVQRIQAGQDRLDRTVKCRAAAPATCAVARRRDARPPASRPAPPSAIAFGDLLDAQSSDVVKAKRPARRTTTSLGYLNARPRIDLPGARPQPRIRPCRRSSTRHDPGHQRIDHGDLPHAARRTKDMQRESPMPAHPLIPGRPKHGSTERRKTRRRQRASRRSSWAPAWSSTSTARLDRRHDRRRRETPMWLVGVLVLSTRCVGCVTVVSLHRLPGRRPASVSGA
jgi:hypothetical protein